MSPAFLPRRLRRLITRPFCGRSFLIRWFIANSLVSGACALLWLIFRSGTRPSRLAYPCQRAAISTATLAFGVPFVAAVLAVRGRVLRWARTPAALAAAGLGLVLTASLAVYLSQAGGPDGIGPTSPAEVLRAPDTYRAQLYHVSDCPTDPAGERFVGLSNLLGLMGQGGLKFYDSAAPSPVAGPGGIIAAGDVVVIKINYQWDQRGGTNTDLLRALIRAILDHPAGFTGEVVVCENAQFNSTSNFDRALNNAQDHSLSPRDVVVAFQAQGANVSYDDWTLRRSTQVSEYSSGDTNSGYVVGPYDASYQGKLSYAKFRTTAGTYISVRYGIWDPAGGTYDRARLKFINVPVLKSHHATYGATAATKHYMGVVTDQFSTNTHSAIRNGILGALMGQIQTADLNIIDAIWINANPNSGPQTSYSGATRRDELVASLDPIALDLWSVKNILVPGFLGNGYSPPWPTPSADPDLPSSAFRVYLDNSMNRLLAAGYEVTNDLTRIDVAHGNGAAGDFDGNSTVDAADYDQFDACFTGPGGGPVGPGCAAGDFDGDDDVDCDDWERFRLVWTSSQPVPDLPACLGSSSLPPPVGARARLLPPVPNPADGAVAISYALDAPGPVRLSVFDLTGALVRTLVDEGQEAGARTVAWDGRDSRGERVARGVYLCRLEAGRYRASEKIVLR